MEQLPVYRSHYFRVRSAVSSVLGHFSAHHTKLESPLNREVLSVRYRPGKLDSIFTALTYSRVRACTASVALSGIILSDNSAQWPYQLRDSWCSYRMHRRNVSCVNAFVVSRKLVISCLEYRGFSVNFPITRIPFNCMSRWRLY